MSKLNAAEEAHKFRGEGCTWVPEYGSWMVEATPDRPYTAYVDDLVRVERNMRLRRRRLLTVLSPDEIAPTVSTYVLMGATHVPEQTCPPSKPGGPYSESEYVSDDVINPHPRFGTLTRNIRERRGSKVNIRVPLFRDVSTPEYSGRPPPSCASCGVWSYGQSQGIADSDLVMTGCAGAAEWLDTPDAGAPVRLSKWLVDVRDSDLKGLFYRSSPGVVVADADWPRNGEIVVGAEVEVQAGEGSWIRLQNGYYLPVSSEDGRITYLRKQSSRARSTHDGMDRSGFPSPALTPKKSAGGDRAVDDLDIGMSRTMSGASLGSASSADDSAEGRGGGTGLSDVKPAIHMDAMAFGMGCCCLQVTFQAQVRRGSCWWLDWRSGTPCTHTRTHTHITED